MAAPSPLLAQLIDDYIVWFVDWHRSISGGRASTLQPPARFAIWHSEVMRSLSGEQPAVERLTTLQEQLHTLVKLVLMKTPNSQALDPKDDASIAAKYLELMQELRRFERAFALAASNLDPLTGLRTRLMLSQEIERELSRSVRTGRPFYVAMMDIDHFKKINDTYGHDNGDRVLAAVANHISRSLRTHDDAYRLGGEEFLLCLKETDAAGSKLVLERLRSGLEKMPIKLADGSTVTVTASFGSAESSPTMKIEDLLKKADEALYRAKNGGRNCVVV